MYPHFFGLDLTAALPWFLMGFLLSACILGLWNFLSGSRSRPPEPVKVIAPDARLTGQLAELQEHLAETQADLELARTSAMQIANEKVRIETDLKKSVLPVMPLAQIDPGHAEQLSQLQADLATAKASAVRYADERSKLEVELRKAVQQAATIVSAPAAGATPAGTLPAATALTDLDIRRRNEMADLHAELWALRRSDSAHTEQDLASGTEIARLKAQLAAPSPADLEVKRLTSEVSKWKAKVDAQITELSNKSGFIAIRDAELDRLEALLANNNTATKVFALNGTPATPMSASASTTDAAKLEAESARLRAEVTRLSNEVANKSTLIGIRDAELDRLESFVVKGQNGSQLLASLTTAGSPVSIIHATQYTSEITRLRALVDQTRGELSDKAARLAARETELGKLQGQTGQAAAYIAEHNQLRAEIARLSQQNAALSLDIANYQRVREALQEANRIAGKG